MMKDISPDTLIGTKTKDVDEHTVIQQASMKHHEMIARELEETNPEQRRQPQASQVIDAVSDEDVDAKPSEGPAIGRRVHFLFDSWMKQNQPSPKVAVSPPSQKLLWSGWF